METLYHILVLVAGLVVIWILYRYIRTRPDQFNRENLSKSFSTMAVLALLLIVFVTFLVFMVRST